MMKLNFCTLFSSNYLTRGLVMYESLLKHCDNFHLYIFAFDDLSYNFFKNQTYQNLTVISLNEFEDAELLKVKNDRTVGEYCWTCTSSTILYCLEKFNLSNCTYLDADMQFYSNPKVLVEEMGDKSVLITEHRYTKEYDQSEESGIYCVQFVTIKNDEKGMKVIRWWREKCLEWCFNRAEDGKFGDQKYLDDWPQRFEGVHELKNLGGGVAPWNVQQYQIKKNNNKLIGIEKATGKEFDIVFFHYHGVKFYDDDIVMLSHPAYNLENEVINNLYKPYVRLLNQCKAKVNSIDFSFNPNGSSGKSPEQPISLKFKIKLYKALLKKSKKNLFAKGFNDKIRRHYFYISSKI